VRPGGGVSLKSLLMPWISQRLLSASRVARMRQRAEAARARSGAAHEVHYFHQVDDPYSALAAASLPMLCERYAIVLHPHVVGAPSDAAAPERDRLIAYSRGDAARLARHHGLEFRDMGCQPSPQAVGLATARLLTAVSEGRFVERAAAISQDLWRNDAGDLACQPPPPVDSLLQGQLLAASQLRARLGHYLGATFYYAGEWYWGIDRLHHLEQRLQELDVQRPGVSGCLFPPSQDWDGLQPKARPPAIDFFFSFRSPYSAIVAERVFRLGRLAGAEVRLRYVLPMVMRGLPVPKIKRAYIAMDAAREARLRGIDFGRINDPVGRPTERGLSLIPLAEREGKGQEYVLSFMHGVWAQGLDAGSDSGLRQIVERAGLDWEAAREALHEDGWRLTAEANRQALFALGLWGVPSFAVNGTAVWGQDRLWAVEAALFGPTADLGFQC